MAGFADRVYETSTSTGTGTFTLAGAVIGFQTFAAGFGTATAYYSIVNRSVPTEWEVGSFTVSGESLARAAGNVLSSSAGAGTLVNFSAGTKDVFNAPPAAQMATWSAAATPPAPVTAVATVLSSGSVGDGSYASAAAGQPAWYWNNSNGWYALYDTNCNCNCNCCGGGG